LGAFTIDSTLSHDLFVLGQISASNHRRPTMTPDLDAAIRHAVAATQIEADLPAAILAAITAAGYLLVDRGRWEHMIDAAIDAIYPDIPE
jgi:hypothetical protein